MLTKYFTKACVVLSAVLTLVACEGSKQGPSSDPRDAFIGDYTFVSDGDIDLYAGALKLFTIPLDQSGEMSIAYGNESNTVWVIAEGDSTIAYVSGNQMFMDPTTDEATFGELVMHLSFTYGKATLDGKQLSWTFDVEIAAEYKTYSLSGSGQVDIVATKK